MKNFLKSIFVFTIPIGIFFFIIFILDPLNYFKYFNLFEDSKSKNFDYILHHVNNIEDNNAEILIFGDSRMDLLDSKIFESKTELTTSNFSIGGANFNEIHSMFWHVIKNNNLVKRVYFGLNSSLLNYNILNRTDEKLDLVKNPLIFFTSRSNIKASFFLVKNILSQNKYNIEQPNLNFEEFWNYQLSSSTRNLYKTFKYDKSIEKKLLRINDYCSKNDIEFYIIFPPTHTELQFMTSEYNINLFEENLITNLRSKGVSIINLDVPSEFTSNKNNYNDPYHFKPIYSGLIIDKIINDIKRESN